MKKLFKFFNLLLILSLLFSCAGKKSELITAHKKVMEKSIKANYEYQRELGFAGFANEGSVEFNVTVDNLGSIVSGRSGQDLSSFDGLGLNFYTNSFGKKLGNELEIALTKGTDFVSLLNLKLEESKMIMSLPFLTNNKTFFANIKELSEKVGDSLGSEMNVEEAYKTLCHMISNPTSEKDAINFYNNVIDVYFENIDVKKDGEYYVYTVSKDQSKKVVRAVYDEFIAYLKKTNPMYSMKSTTETYDEFITDLEESDGFSYTVKQKVENGEITYTEANFDIESLDIAKLEVNCKKDVQTINAAFQNDDGKFTFDYNHKKNGDEYEGSGEVIFGFLENTDKLFRGIISSKSTKNDFSWILDGNYLDPEKPQPVMFSINAEKGKPENKIIAMMNIADETKASFDGVYSKTSEQVLFSGATGLVMKKNPVDVSMATELKINKDRVKTLEFAPASEQENAVALEDADIQNITMEATMGLSSVLQALGIDPQLFMGGGL